MGSLFSCAWSCRLGRTIDKGKLRTKLRSFDWSVCVCAFCGIDFYLFHYLRPALLLLARTTTTRKNPSKPPSERWQMETASVHSDWICKLFATMKCSAGIRSYQHSVKWIINPDRKDDFITTVQVGLPIPVLPFGKGGKRACERFSRISMSRFTSHRKWEMVNPFTPPGVCQLSWDFPEGSSQTLVTYGNGVVRVMVGMEATCMLCTLI